MGRHLIGKIFMQLFPKVLPLVENLSSSSNYFANDTLFSLVRDLITSANEINDDLKKIEAWAYQWRMSFNLDPLKQAQEVIFSRKKK